MHILSTPLDGVVVVETTKHLDSRGEFFRAYCQNELTSIIGKREIVQINVSKSHTIGAVRGIHFQYPPYAEMKLLRCLRGKVWDVAVDLRSNSSTFLKWHGEELTPDNARMMVIPEGCAHAFQALEEDSELLYLHTAPYTPESEGALNSTDPRLAILWPLAVTELSDRDRLHPFIDSDFKGFCP